MSATLGLPDDEQELYEYLLTRPPVRRAELEDFVASAGRGWSVDVVLRNLQSAGLVARIPTEPVRFAVVEPELALDALLLRRERAVAAARRRVTELSSRFHGRTARCDPHDLVDIVYGQQAIGAAVEDLQRGARAEVCATDAPPYALVAPGATSHPVNGLELDQLAGGMSYRVLYHPRGLDLPGRLADLQAGLAAGEQARVCEVPIKLLISDQPLALLPVERRPVELASALRVEDSTLLEALQETFEIYWRQAIPLLVPEHRSQLDAALPSATERNLLRLLVGGLSDAAIARQLGWSDRTVRRHLRLMMGRLNVQTRFQAGYQAVQRGWLGDG